MKNQLFLLAALAFALAIPAHAQDETPGQQSKIVASIPVGGYSCGRVSSVNCYGVPANIGGTFWLDAVPTAYVPHGFIYFFGVADLSLATITHQTFTLDANHHVVTLHVVFNGVTNDGDGDTYTGTGDFTFSYYKISQGSGRGGGYPTYIQVMRSGLMTIVY
jgi:hypothetical protein